jgi:hypothetical protein
MAKIRALDKQTDATEPQFCGNGAYFRLPFHPTKLQYLFLKVGNYEAIWKTAKPVSLSFPTLFFTLSSIS